MSKSNFFDKFFKGTKNSSNEIVRYNLNKEFEIQDQIKNKIIEIEIKISEYSKAIIEAQMIKLRSTFSKSNNFIERIGKNVYNKKANDSIAWYQQELKELYLKRKELKINLEKIQGKYWLNRIKRFLKFILIGFFILFSLFIFLSGFMIIIYLLPLLILIFLVYSLNIKKY